MALTELRHKVSHSEVGRIDRVVQGLTQLSRSDIRGMFEHGCVFLDGRPCLDSGLFVNENSLVLVKYDPHHRYKERSQYQSRRFRIVHEDPYLIVVEKSAGLLTVPTVRREKENLVEALNVYLRRGRASGVYAAVVHRLDRDTSGLLVFGKNLSIAKRLKDQFEAHKPLREYLAIVAGVLDKPKGTFRSFLSTDEDLNQVSMPMRGKENPSRRSDRKPEGRGDKHHHHVKDGKPRFDGAAKPFKKKEPQLAITHYQVVEVFKNATLVRVRLETGRRNQIRVHFSEIGHPVLGDTRYETDLARHPFWKYPRLALHATQLGFTHPLHGKKLNFKSDPGIEFQEFLKSQHRP
jgi:23S rRNA pseudouridine1911/1915/1917 synthase